MSFHSNNSFLREIEKTHYDGVTKYNPAVNNTWADSIITGGGNNNYDWANTFQNNLDQLSNVEYLPEQNGILSNAYQQDLFGAPDSFDWVNSVMKDGKYDSSWYTNFSDEPLSSSTDFFDPSLGYTLEEAGILTDITSINNPESGILENYGLIEYNEDGSVNSFDSNQAIATLTQAAADPDISPYQKSEILGLAGKLSSAADAGLDSFNLDVNNSSVLSNEFKDAYNTPSIPNGATSYQSIEGEKYIDPFSPNFIETSGRVMPEGRVDWLGNRAGDYLRSYGSDGYVSDTATPAMLAAQEPKGIALNNGVPISQGQLERANFAGKHAIDQYGKNEYGQPNDGMIDGVGYVPQPTFASRFDDFTDGVRDVGGMILKPLNWATDTIGLGASKVGQMIGDNSVGRGFNNFGNLVNSSGDYLFGDGDRSSLLGTVMNMPDSLVNMGTGVAHGNWDMAKAGAMGFLSGPASILGNLASIPLSGLVDVAGIDKISIGGGGKSGGGGGKGKPKGKARKNVPIIGNAGGMKNGIQQPNTGTGTGGDGSLAQDGTDYDLADVGGRNDFAEKYGDGALAQRLKDLNLNTVGGGGDNGKSFEATAADTSQVAKSIAKNQGNSGNEQPDMEMEDGMTILEQLAPGLKVQPIAESLASSSIDPTPFSSPDSDFALAENEKAFS